MFRTITRLFFGGEEETPEEVKSGEVVEEGWLVVSHQEAGSENQGAELTDTQLSNSGPHGDTAANMDTDNSFRVGTPACFSKLEPIQLPSALGNTQTNVLDPEPTVQSSSSSSSSTTSSPAITGSVSRPKALVEVTQLTCTQKAKAWADPHHMSRNAIQRQNRVRQGVQHHSFHLQQPGHRNLSH